MSESKCLVVYAYIHIVKLSNDLVGHNMELRKANTQSHNSPSCNDIHGMSAYLSKHLNYRFHRFEYFFGMREIF